MEDKELKNENIEEVENTEVVRADEVNEVVNEEPKVEEEYNGPTVVTATRYDYRTMKYFNMYNMIYKRHFGIIYIAMGLFSIGFGAFTCYNALQAENANFTNFVLPFVFVLFGAYFIYQSFTMEKLIDKNITRHFMQNPKVVTVNVKMTEEKVELEIAGRGGEPISIDWAYVSEIIEIPEYFFMNAQGQPVIIEKNPDKVIEGNYEDLVNMIMEKTNAKPYKKIDKVLVKKPITYVHPDEIADEVEEVEEENDSNEN